MGGLAHWISYPFTVIREERIMGDWLNIRDPTITLVNLPVIHSRGLAPLTSPLGVVMHTTNPGTPAKPGRLLSLEESRNDFAGSSGLLRSAHFMVDQSGRIAQFRSLREGAGHIGSPWNPRYVGIEHTAHWREALTDKQMTASAALLTVLKSELSFSYVGLSQAGTLGVGVHQQFGKTWCGDGRFWNNGTFGPDFNTILQRAAQRSPVGKWNVKVGDIGWIYTFMAGTDFSSGPAAWQSFDGALTGIGSWKVAAKLRIEWSNGTIEEWNFPLSSTGELGNLVAQGDSGPYGSNTDKRDITASRMD
jgi:hypothetical protein